MRSTDFLLFFVLYRNVGVIHVSSDPPTDTPALAMSDVVPAHCPMPDIQPTNICAGYQEDCPMQ